MKKHQEGYVLVYVMVALVLLSLLGAVSCSIAVDNLKAQRSSIDRMQDEYAAEALVEQTRATLNGYTYSGDDSTYYTTLNTAQSDATAKFKAYLDDVAESLSAEGEDPPLKVDWDDAEITWSEVVNNKYTATVELELTAGQPNSTVAVETTVELTLTLELEPRYGDPPRDSEGNITGSEPFYGYTYTVTVSEPKYTSFAHTTVDANDETPANAEAAAETTAETPAASAYAAAGEEIKAFYDTIEEGVKCGVDGKDTKTLARNMAYEELQNELNSQSVTVVWPNKVNWEKVSDEPNEIKTATLTLKLISSNTTATVEIALTRVLIKNTTDHTTYEGSSSFGTGNDTSYACTITASKPEIKSVTTS